jgi:hypothetical protein
MDQLIDRHKVRSTTSLSFLFAVLVFALNKVRPDICPKTDQVQITTGFVLDVVLTSLALES